MSTPVPEDRRIHLGVAPGTGSDGFSVPTVIAVATLAIVVLGSVVSMVVGGVTPAALITSAFLLVLSLAGLGAARWLPKRFGAARPAAVEEWLGIGPAGISRTSVGGTTHYPWETIGGVRIHSVLSSVGAPNQTVLLDLLGPAPGPAATAAHAANAGPLLVRILLRIASGLDIHLAPQLAREVGMTIQATRPDLWRGYTRDSGNDYVEFHSYDRPVAGFNEVSGFSGFGQPTWENFGGGAPR